MCISTWLYTKFCGNFVGYDEFGNAYYESRCATRFFKRKNRWVYYKGMAEASKVPGKWFNWLHYQTNVSPRTNYSSGYTWEKQHTPNTTGIVSTYYPNGHFLGKDKRDRSTGDYEAWRI